MESSQFSLYFSNFPTIFKLFDGVFSFDKIPKNLKIHHFVICNTDISSGEGKHWFCLYRTNKDLVECFDSLGINDLSKKTVLVNICNFTGAKELKINNTQLQLLTSQTCGKFCLMFVIERLHNPDLTFDELLDFIFTDDCNENEKTVANFFDEIVDGANWID